MALHFLSRKVFGSDQYLTSTLVLTSIWLFNFSSYQPVGMELEKI